jgi:beta-phosphoglucomutase
MTPRSALLFDHDGVLVASEPLHWQAWKRLTAELDLPHDEALIRSLVGKTAPQILVSIFQRHRPDYILNEEELQRHVQRKNDLYMEEARLGLKPYPGVREGLVRARAQGLKTAVVSNARRRELRSVLTDLGLIELFDVVISREDAGAAKPDPTPYLMAAASLEVKPADCVAIEDSPPGLEAALMAKIPAAAVLTNFPRSALEAPVPGRPDLKPVWIGASMEEFFQWVLA